HWSDPLYRDSRIRRGARPQTADRRPQTARRTGPRGHGRGARRHPTMGLLRKMKIIRIIIVELMGVKPAGKAGLLKAAGVGYRLRGASLDTPAFRGHSGRGLFT